MLLIRAEVVETGTDGHRAILVQDFLVFEKAVTCVSAICSCFWCSGLSHKSLVTLSHSELSVYSLPTSFLPKSELWY